MPADDVELMKMASLRGRLDRIRSGLAPGLEFFQRNEQSVESVAFNVLLAVQEAVDLCAHVIAREGWEPPESLAAGFSVLERHLVLTPQTADAMRRGTRLRNLIAHGYSRIQPALLFTSATAGVGEFERFLSELAKWEGASEGASRQPPRA